MSIVPTTPRTELFDSLNINSINDEVIPGLKVVVQSIANSRRLNINMGYGLNTHLDAFRNRVEQIASLDADVIIFTELNKGLTDESKAEIINILSNNGYNHGGSFLENDKSDQSFETAMFYHESVTMLHSESGEGSRVDPNEHHTYTIINGALLANIRKGNNIYKIGAMHSTLTSRVCPRNVYYTTYTEWEFIKAKTLDGYCMFGNFNVSDTILKLGKKNVRLGELFASVPFVGTNVYDFICGEDDFLPDSVADFYGNDNIIRKKNKTVRAVTTLIQALGYSQMLSMHHPITFEDTMNMSANEIVEMSKDLDFRSMCFDHCTGVFNISP